MPGPTPHYPNHAARQRAYLRRKEAAEAGELQEASLITSYAYAVQAALVAARKAGSEDPLLATLYRRDPLETLRALADYFFDQAGTPPAARPWREAPTDP